MLKDVAVCKQSNRAISVNIDKNISIAYELNFSCANCAAKCGKKFFTSVTSTNSEKKIYDINLRFIYGLRAIGKGQQAADMLFGILNLRNAPRVSRYLDVLENATTEVCHNTLKRAVKEAVELNSEGNRDISIALDGTWQKQGHISLNGVVTATSVDSGKVLDYEVLSKYCRCQNKYKNEHNNNCVANYSGVSGGMEVQGVKNIFKRSLDMYNVRYVRYLGDGDSKAYNNVSELKVYGDDCTITKLECIGHVQKRMGTRLRALKLKSQGKQSNEKSLSGRGRLTEAAIKSLTTYYGLVIRRNCSKNSTVEDMKNAVWAQYFHVSSSDEKPMHNFCPVGEESWCKYKQSIVKNVTYKHSEHFHLPTDVMLAIRPIFSDLGNTNLLKKCLHGKTQNPNESVNSVIWARLPKTVFVGLKTLKFGVADAVACFNEGAIVRFHVLQALGLKPGKNTVKFMYNLDRARISRADREFDELSKKAREKVNAAKRKLEEKFEEDDTAAGSSYSSGAY